MTDTLIWLRDYFTEEEINEYRDDFLAEYFEQKVERGEVETQGVSQGRERRDDSEAEGHGKTTEIGDTEA